MSWLGFLKIRRRVSQNRPPLQLVGNLFIDFKAPSQKGPTEFWSVPSPNLWHNGSYVLFCFWFHANTMGVRLAFVLKQEGPTEFPAFEVLNPACLGLGKMVRSELAAPFLSVSFSCLAPFWGGGTEARSRESRVASREPRVASRVGAGSGVALGESRGEGKLVAWGQWFRWEPCQDFVKATPSGEIRAVGTERQSSLISQGPLHTRSLSMGTTLLHYIAHSAKRGTTENRAICRSACPLLAARQTRLPREGVRTAVGLMCRSLCHGSFSATFSRL